MKDILKPCQCGKNHPWGIVGRKKNVPLYAARAIKTCDNFRPVVNGLIKQDGPLVKISETQRRTGVDGIRAIEDLRISVATYEALKRHGIFTVLEIERMGRRKLLKLAGFGKKCLADLEKGLKYAEPSVKLLDGGKEPVPVNAQEVWAQTGDLNPQAELATRVAIARIKSLANGKTGLNAIAAQWPEFMGFVLSQVTDLRGTLTRDDNKFAHLVAHTDDVVEQLRQVGPLAAKLNQQTQMLAEVIERLDQIQERPPQLNPDALLHFGLIDDAIHDFFVNGVIPKWSSSRHFGLAEPDDDEVTIIDDDLPNEDDIDETVTDADQDDD